MFVILNWQSSMAKASMHSSERTAACPAVTALVLYAWHNVAGKPDLGRVF